MKRGSGGRENVEEAKDSEDAENVKEANMGLFRAKMNLPEAAAHCGMTQKEMKMTFLEFLKYHPADYD